MPAPTPSNRSPRLKTLIGVFGFTNPILVDKQNTIVAGHGRLRAAEQLGMNHVPTICLENLTEDQVRAYILADNKLAERAGWDESILAIELGHLLTVDLGFDVTVTGFDVPEIDLIIQGTATKPGEEEVLDRGSSKSYNYPAWRSLDPRQAPNPLWHIVTSRLIHKTDERSQSGCGVYRSAL